MAMKIVHYPHPALRHAAQPVTTIDKSLNLHIGQMKDLVGRMPLKDIVRDTTDLIEQFCIEAALELTGDNRASAAEMLGAGAIFACDTSLDALETARLHKSRTTFFLGSADAVRAAAADLILVNISAAVAVH